MATMKDRARARGKEAARSLGRFRARMQAEGVDDLRRRVAELEVEVQECRQLNLRLAELTDVVQELLLPVAQRDETRVAELMERYSKGL
jgi:flagellar biosynthesis/type III secretory pathway chaperone